MSNSSWARVVLHVSLLLTPEHLRKERSEQWRADLRDCEELGIPAKEILSGTLAAGFYLRITQGLDSTQIRIKEKPMKFIFPAVIAMAVAVIGGVGTATFFPGPKVEYFVVTDEMIADNANTTPDEPIIIGGYEIPGSGELADEIPEP